jgi:hypothetical protein
MDLFLDTVSVVGPIVGGIAALALFFQLLGWATRRSGSAVTRFAVKDVLHGQTAANVHLTGGRAIEDVRILGFVSPSSGKDELPYEFGRLVVLEHPDGRRTLLRAKLIQQIEVPPTTP